MMLHNQDHDHKTDWKGVLATILTMERKSPTPLG